MPAMLVMDLLSKDFLSKIYKENGQLKLLMSEYLLF